MWLAVLSLAAVRVALAQAPAPGRITGTIHVGGAHEHEDPTIAHESVDGATVRVLETPYRAETNDRGEFSLPALPPGDYVVEARRIGFRSARQTVHVEAGRVLQLAFHLQPAPITVDAIVISALEDQGQRTYDLSELQKVPLVGTANVTAVTLRQIKQVHASDPWELARQTTGLEVHQQGQGPGFASDAVIRGFTSDHSTDVALVIDGVPINEPINGHGEGYADWNMIFPSALADIQLVKGPISPLFGNFATGGAVNVTTQASTQQTTVQLEGGSYTFGGATLTTGLERGPWGAFLGAHGVHSDGWRDNSAYDLGHVIARGNRRVTPELLLDAGAQFYGSKWRSPGYLTLDQFTSGILTPAADPTDGGLNRRFMGRLAAVLNQPHFQWNSTAWGYASYWHLYLTIPELAGENAGEGVGSQTEELDRRRAVGGRSIARWTVGTLDLTAGVDAQKQVSTYGIWGTVQRQRDLTLKRLHGTFTSAGGMAGAAKTFGRRVRLEGALRADWVEPQSTDQVSLLPKSAASHLVPQPKLGAVLYASGDLQFYASAARGFRNSPGTITDPTLAPVTLWAYETGARFSRRPLEGSVAFFRLSTQNETVYNPITLENEQSGHSLREGIEAELKAHPVPQFEAEAHITLNTKGIFFLTDTAGMSSAAPRIAPLLQRTGAEISAAAAHLMHDVGNTGAVPGVADYSGRVGFTVRPTPKYWFSAWATVMGPYVPLGEPDTTTDGFAIGNIQAGALLNDHIELTFGLDNVLNQRAPELRASGAINPVAPRSVHLNVNTRW